MELTDVLKKFHSTAEEYTFFPSAHGIFSRIDSLKGQKTNLRKFKKIEIIPTIFSDHNGIKLEIN